MATQYTSILKLALPVQGELSGTWGDVVNDNITSMVEEAIAGRAVINTWTTNSHTLTTANGTTSESRCAMLEFTDTGAALTGAGEVICPAQPKIYIAKNASGQAITVKTFAGTGIAVQNGETKFVFCDGTNVVEAVTSMTTLKVGTGVQVSTILDEDNMASDSATALATQQSIKAYVDSQVTAQDLDFAGDTGTGAVDLDSQSLTVAGTANEIETSASGQTLTVGLPSAIIVTTSVTTPTVQITNLNANDGTPAVTIADATGQTTINDAVLTTADINGGTIDNTTIGGTTAAAGSFTTVSATGNITSQGQVITNTINEQTATTGVTVDGVLLKDGGATFTADAVFGDNDKAIFGAGSDLQIYHDGSHSYVKDNGTGDLKLQGNNLYLQNIAGETYLGATSDGLVFLRYDNATKLATTSTGVDVTGTVVSDGLTADGDAYVNGALAVGTATSGVLNLVRPSTNYIRSNETNGAIAMGVRDAIRLFTGQGAGEFLTNERLRISNNGDITFYDTNGNASFVYDESAGSVFNEQGDNKDFRVESDSSANMLLVDAANNRVGINRGTPDYTLDVQGNAGIAHTGAVPLLLDGTATGIAYVPISNVATSAIGNGAGIEFRAESTVQERQLAFLTAEWTDNADATRTASMELYNTISGTGRRILSQTGSQIVINQDGRDLDFRVESSSNTNMLFVDGGSNWVNVGTGNNYVQSKLFVNGDIKANYNNQIALQYNVSGSTGDYYKGFTGTSPKTTSARGLHIFNYDGDSDEGINFYSGAPGGTTYQKVKFKAGETGEIVFNEDSFDQDFRIESDNNANMLLVDAGLSRVGIGKSSINYTLDVEGSIASTHYLRVDSNSGVAGSSLLTLKRNGNDTGDYLQMRDGSNNLFATFDEGGIIFNEIGGDTDFRVESDTNTHALWVDAGENAIGLQRTDPGAGVDATSAIIGWGGGGQILQSVGTVALNEYVDLTVNSGGGGYTGQLFIVNTVAANAAARTHKMYFLAGRSTDYIVTELGSDTGTSGGANFTITMPSNGLIRVTNNDANSCQLVVAFIGTKSL